MTKTPFEIRLDLLAMAQAILNEQNMNERIRLENDWNVKRDLVLEAASRGVASTIPPFPSVPQYTDDDVIAMAEKLNAFVSKSN